MNASSTYADVKKIVFFFNHNGKFPTEITIYIMELKQMLHILLLIPLVSGFGSFHPAKKSTGALQAILTGPGGKAAASREEDIALTLQIIMSHDDRSTTVTKDQYVQQMSEPSESPTEEEAGRLTNRRHTHLEVVNFYVL